LRFPILVCSCAEDKTLTAEAQSKAAENHRESIQLSALPPRDLCASAVKVFISI
jgi:hypothetical protein